MTAPLLISLVALMMALLWPRIRRYAVPEPRPINFQVNITWDDEEAPTLTQDQAQEIFNQWRRIAEIKTSETDGIN